MAINLLCKHCWGAPVAVYLPSKCCSGCINTIKVVQWRTRCSINTMKVLQWGTRCSINTIKVVQWRTRCSINTMKVVQWRTHCSINTMKVLQWRTRCSGAHIASCTIANLFTKPSVMYYSENWIVYSCFNKNYYYYYYLYYYYLAWKCCSGETSHILVSQMRLV